MAYLLPGPGVECARSGGFAVWGLAWRQTSNHVRVSYVCRAIQHLAFLLQSPAALADETLAAAILLGGYEVLDGSSDRSWIVHARGIGQLMRARGAAAHEQGMGRTMLMAWRPYLVVDTFIHGGPYFLGNPEWTRKAMTKEIARAENERGLGSLIGQLVDCF